MEKVPFWEETYRNRDINTFPAEPNGTILEFEHLLKKDSAILEAGCGEGQNVRYLAKNGFSDIDAFDLSEAGISKLKWFCEREGLRINAFTKAALLQSKETRSRLRSERNVEMPKVRTNI